ncbi:MAG: TA system VapC family ribonuclease toxin [Thermoleophilaceae bacterium]
MDANVLLHAGNSAAREHERAREWLIEALDGGEAVAFTWLVSLAFLRLATNRAVFPRPLAPDQAIGVLEAWLAAPAAVTVEPTRRHLSLLGGLLARAGTAGNLVNDAHLAAIALEHDAVVVSFDRDFGRFEGLRTLVPG